LGKKAAEQQVAEEMRQLTQFSVEHSGEPAFWMGPDARFIYVNRAASRSLGYTQKELLSMTVHDIDPDFPVEVWPDHWREVCERGSFTVESRHRTKEGRIFPVEITVNYLKFKGKEYNCAFARDITERKQAEDALKQSEATLSSIFSAAPIGIGLVSNRVLKQVNDRLCSMIGYSRDELIGKSARILYPTDEDYEYVGREKYAQISQRGTGIVETFWKCKDGHVIDVLMRSTPLDINDLSAGVTFTALDITDRKRTEKDLVRYREHLEQLVEERTVELKAAQEELIKKERLATLGKLTATVSHELRNPLGTINSSLYSINEQIRGKGLSVERALDRARRNITRCDGIIEELLDFTRVRDLELETTDIDQWLDEVLDSLPLPEGIILVRVLTSELTVRLDKERSRRCIINTIVNACQAIEQKGIIAADDRVTIQTSVDADTLKINVVDTGVGIDAEQLEQVFEPLYSTKSFGVGLGLTNTKQIMEQHGGGIEIKSKLGAGTTVTLWLPLGNSEVNHPLEKPLSR